MRENRRGGGGGVRGKAEGIRGKEEMRGEGRRGCVGEGDGGRRCDKNQLHYSSYNVYSFRTIFIYIIFYIIKGRATSAD